MAEFREALDTGWTQLLEVDEVLHEARTEHQHLIIFTNRLLGRVMALDGVIQTTERDEFIYHEMLCHVPIFAHGNPSRVLVLGGGDGGAIREVLRHPGVGYVKMIEIDAGVIESSRRYLPHHSDGAFDDPRLDLEIGDGLAFVARTDQSFDVILSDSTDPIGPGEALHSRSFYASCRRCLDAGGVFVSQSGNSFDQLDAVASTIRHLASMFEDVTCYRADVPTYIGGSMLLAWACDLGSVRETPLATLSERHERSSFPLRYYTPEIHRAAFALPRYVAERISVDRGV